MIKHRDVEGQDDLIEASFERLPLISQQVLKLRVHERADGLLSLVDVARFMSCNISTVVTRLQQARAELIELCGGRLSAPFVEDQAQMYFGDAAWMIVIGTEGKVKSCQTLPTFGPTAESAVAAWHAANDPIVSRRKIRTIQERIESLERSAAFSDNAPTIGPRIDQKTIYVESGNDLLGLYLAGAITNLEHESCLSLLEHEQ